MNYIAIVLGLGMVISAQANETGMRIGTIEMQKAIEGVESGKKAKVQLEKEYKLKEKMFQDEEQAIRKLYEELQKQSLVLNEEAKQKKGAELNERSMKFRESYEKTRQELSKKEGELTKPIVENLKTIIQEVSQEKKYDLILDRNNNAGPVLFSKDENDITKTVIENFNKKYK